MTSPERTITTIGLGLRDETMIRSLVSVAQDRPGLQWRFVDDIEADVALCAPDSALARVALGRGRQSGRPRCVCYGGDDVARAQYDAAIRTPIRVSELWALLDTLVRMPDGPDDAPVPATGKARPDLAGHTVAHVLSTLVGERRDDPERWSLRIGAIVVDLSMPQRILDIVAPPDCAFDSLLDAACTTVVDRVVIAPADGPVKPRAGMKSLDVLLWKIGLRQAGGPAAVWARDGNALRLRRWPDFGHLGAHRPHLAMTSQLTRVAMTPTELASAVGCEQDHVRAFLNACALLDLVQVEAGGTRGGAIATRPTGGLTKLMRSFRAALRMGD